MASRNPRSTNPGFDLLAAMLAALRLDASADPHGGAMIVQPAPAWVSTLALAVDNRQSLALARARGGVAACPCPLFPVNRGTGLPPGVPGRWGRCLSGLHHYFNVRKTMDTTVTVLRKQTIRSGDNYQTVEVALTLAGGASDADIAAAIEQAGRMDTALAELVAARSGSTPSAPAHYVIKDPTSPATGEYAEDAEGNTTACKGGQFGYLAKLAMDFGYGFDQLGAVVRGAGYDPLTLTKGQASALIESWQAPAHPPDEGEAPGDEDEAPGENAGEPTPEELAELAAEEIAVAALIAQITAVASPFTGGFEKARTKIEGKLGKPLEEATVAELQPYLELLQKGNGNGNGK